MRVSREGVRVAYEAWVLAWQDTAAVTADVLNAIQYLHDVGITHRDLKVWSPQTGPDWGVQITPNRKRLFQTGADKGLKGILQTLSGLARAELEAASACPDRDGPGRSVCGRPGAA